MRCGGNIGMPGKIAVLASTKGTDMQALIDAIGRKELEAEIVAVISNRSDAYALERAKKHGIPSFLVERGSGTKEEYDREIMAVLEKQGAELVLLIGYDRIVGKEFVEKYEGRMMNIHPSLLPAFPGNFDQDVHEAVIDSGVKITGCTLHFVTSAVDGGQIIAQKAVEIGDKDTAESIRERVQAAEQGLIVKAVKDFFAGKLRVEGRQVLGAG